MKQIDGEERERAEARWRAIPRLSLSHARTPLEEAPRLRAALGGGPRILIKRDDYLGAGFGGNKVRKLEYLLAEAQRDHLWRGEVEPRAGDGGALRAVGDALSAGSQSASGGVRRLGSGKSAGGSALRRGD